MQKEKKSSGGEDSRNAVKQLAVGSSWVDRLTDTSNLWLNAIKQEDEGNLLDASIFYLRDANDLLHKGYLTRAALSCSAAANCLINLGNFVQARRLFLESGRIYEEYSTLSIKKSLRETLWALKEAYTNYVHAKENSDAQTVYAKFMAVARKVNPFFPFFLENQPMQTPILPRNSNGGRKMKTDRRVLGAINIFLRTRYLTSRFRNFKKNERSLI